MYKWSNHRIHIVTRESGQITGGQGKTPILWKRLPPTQRREATDKNGGGSLGMDLDFCLLRNKRFSVFCIREWLGTGEPSALQNWAPC